MKKFYVTSIVYPISGGESDAELAEYNGKTKFAQYFERAWTTKFFDSELEALTFLRQLYPDRLLTVFEDTGKIVSTYGHESGLTAMRIRQESKG